MGRLSVSAYGVVVVSFSFAGGQHIINHVELMGIAPMSRNVFPKYSTSLERFVVMKEVESGQNPRSFVSFAIRLRRRKKQKSFGRLDNMTPVHSYRE